MLHFLARKCDVFPSFAYKYIDIGIYIYSNSLHSLLGQEELHEVHGTYQLTHRKTAPGECKVNYYMLCYTLHDKS